MAIHQIKYKIGFIIFTTFICGLGSLMLLTQWSIKKQFLEFTSQRIADSLLPVEKVVIQTYTRHGDLSLFKQNPDFWRRATQRIIRNNIRKARSERAIENLQNNTSNDLSSNQPNDQTPRNDGVGTPDSWERRLRQNQRIFLNNLGLYDLNYLRIAGTRKNIDLQKFHPVTDEDKTIAYLGYSEPREFTRQSEFIFWHEQIKSFWIISFVMLIVSLIAASLLARKISQPLQALNKATKIIADGDKIKPIQIHSKDEIGQLCESFNLMSLELSKNEETRKRWVADISHELRTPLAVLKAQIIALQDGVRPADERNLSLLSEKINSINHLINDLYELSLFDSNALSYEKTSFSLNAHIQEYVRTHKNAFDDAKLDFEFLADKNGNDQIYADKKRIDQLLMNIMQNSIKYTQAPGKVQWKIDCKDHKVQLSMLDSEPGLDSTQLNLIFDRLYRADISRNQSTPGAGLGLSISKSIIEAHNGKIWAKPSTLGGIEVIVEFPLHLE